MRIDLAFSEPAKLVVEHLRGCDEKEQRDIIALLVLPSSALERWRLRDQALRALSGRRAHLHPWNRAVTIHQEWARYLGNRYKREKGFLLLPQAAGADMDLLHWASRLTAGKCLSARHIYRVIIG